MEGTKLKAVIKSIAAQKGMTIADIAKKCDKKPTSLHQILDRDSMSTRTMKMIFKALDEDIVLVLKNGNQFKIE